MIDRRATPSPRDLMIDRRATPSGFNDRSPGYTLGFITKLEAVYIYIDSKRADFKMDLFN